MTFFHYKENSQSFSLPTKHHTHASTFVATCSSSYFQFYNPIFRVTMQRLLIIEPFLVININKSLKKIVLESKGVPKVVGK